MFEHIRKILILIVTVLVLIITLITVARQRKEKEIKDNVKNNVVNVEEKVKKVVNKDNIVNSEEKVKNVVNEVADAVTDNVSKGVNGTGEVLNNVSNFIESDYFFEKDIAQTISSALLFIIPIFGLWLVALAARETIPNNKRRGKFGFSLKEIFTKKIVDKDVNIPILPFWIFVSILAFLLAIVVEFFILVVFTIGSFFTVKKIEIWKIIKRVFKSRFRYPLKITIIRAVLFLVLLLFLFFIFLMGFFYTIFGGHCRGGIQNKYLQFLCRII